MKLLILDGNSILNRSFYGVHSLSTKDGLYTNAIFGFLNILHKLQEEVKPEALCVAFDLKGKTFRHEKYGGYKANRKGMPEELAVQLPIMKDVLTAMNIPIYTCQGWEADDVIGTVSKICCEEQWDCVIATGDRDSLQLVNDRVSVCLATSKGGQTLYNTYTPATFLEEYGFEPEKLVDLKALMGDSSDNIPGVAGVGPKTATDLLLKFGSLQALYENLQDSSIRESLRTKLVENREMAFLSYDLATIRCNAPITFQPSDALCKGVNKDSLRELFLRLEFLKLMERYELTGQKTETVVCSMAEMLPDCEADCAVHMDKDLRKCYIATDHGVAVADLMEDREYLVRLFASSSKKICSNAKDLYHTLREENLPEKGISFDISLAAYCLNPSMGDYSVPRLAISYLSCEATTPEEQTEVIWKLGKTLSAQIDEEGLTSLYYQTELPLCCVLAGMEQCGILVDKLALTRFGAMLSERIIATQEAVYSMAGEVFNINSPKQLGEVLFEHMGLPSGKKTKSGYSTGADVLEKLKHLHPIIPTVLEYRMLTKLNSTYAEGLVRCIEDDGRIHTTFQNMTTATGRLSSTDPNLQNIPVRTDMGSEIRKMFIPKEGWVLVDADYSQIELRVLAHISGDKRMQEAFSSGADFHTATAAQVYGVSVENVTAEMRRSAKAVNFGVVYGISEFSLADDIGVSRAQAAEFIRTYLDRFSGVAAYQKKVVEDAYTNGYVSTLSGRKRNIPELNGKNYMLRMAGERIALNTPIQGTAADIMKRATVQVADALRRAGLRGRLLLQVHDELIVECPVEEVQAVSAILKQEMESAGQLDVPLTADVHYGESWYAAK